MENTLDMMFMVMEMKTFAIPSMPLLKILFLLIETVSCSIFFSEKMPYPDTNEGPV